ncbi:hypothetical protein OPV22_029059 [Ensete ventricosum]|uniref:Senescence domain-containing protein n=1 Tax=Ensete ventricosum TaxID=4639 RepID=A0AAV8Q046_ENSVE|nr:hypothetical protein OPV22_029059 [Ensete ventricosum]
MKGLVTAVAGDVVDAATDVVEKRKVAPLADAKVVVAGPCWRSRARAKPFSAQRLHLCTCSPSPTEASHLSRLRTQDLSRFAIVDEDCTSR